MCVCVGGGGGWGGGLDPTPGKSQMFIGFLRNTGTDPPRQAIGHQGSNCFSREDRKTLCEIC